MVMVIKVMTPFVRSQFLCFGNSFFTW